MPSITLKRLNVRNFRNLENGEFLFQHRSAVEGKNHIGKSNTLEAVAFLLIGTLLIDCNNLASIKPLSDTKKEVEVEGEFVKEDENGEVIGTKVFKKVYYENWVKTRGTTIVEMKGHITDLYVDGVQQKTLKDYDQAVNDFFEFTSPRLSANIDVKRAIVDQKYLTEEIDYKLLRSIVIDVAGDVSNEEVLASNEMFNLIKDDLRNTGGKLDVAIKNQSQKVTQIQNQIKEVTPVIDYMKKETDVDAIALELAKKRVEEINKQITALKDGSASLKDVVSEQIRKDLQDLKGKLFECQNNELDALQKKNQAVSEELAKARELKKKIADEKDELFAKKGYLEGIISKNETLIKANEAQIEFETKERKKLGEEYKEAKAKTYSNSEIEKTCPNCGYVLNAEEIEQRKEDFERRKKEEVDDLRTRGFALKDSIDRLNFENSDKQKIVMDAQNDLKETERKLQEKTEDLKTKSTEIENLEKKILPFTKSDEITKLEEDIAAKQKELDEAGIKYRSQTISMESQIESQIKELANQIAADKKVITDHEVYLDTQKKLKLKETELSNLTDKLTDEEQKLIALRTFMKTKFEMLDKKVTDAFGVRFQLFKDNIKVGSWDETCVPYIIGKETLYTNGSTSEKIRTNIAIIEAFKKAFNLPDLPILFDEGESLDSDTVANELVTESQIICAKVNDYYTVPHVVAF